MANSKERTFHTFKVESMVPLDPLAVADTVMDHINTEGFGHDGGFLSQEDQMCLDSLQNKANWKSKLEPIVPSIPAPAPSWKQIVRSYAEIPLVTTEACVFAGRRLLDMTLKGTNGSGKS